MDEPLTPPQIEARYDPDEAPDWSLVMKMVGLPDYAVAFSVWPWPDGGWHAGVALLDREWADEQELPAKIRALPEQGMRVEFDICDGWANGINIHAGTAAEAIRDLWDAVRD